MKQFTGMLRDTWILWVVLLLFGILGGLFIKSVFFGTIPITIFTFIYFSFMRYDEEGNHKTVD